LLLFIDAMKAMTVTQHLSTAEGILIADVKMERSGDEVSYGMASVNRVAAPSLLKASPIVSM